MNKNEAMLVHLLTEAVIGLMENPKGGANINVPVSVSGQMQRKMEGLKGRKRVAMGLNVWREKAIFGSTLWNLAFPSKNQAAMRVLQSQAQAWQEFQKLTVKQKSMLLPTLRSQCESLGKKKIQKLVLAESRRIAEQAKAAADLVAAEEQMELYRQNKLDRDKQVEEIVAVTKERKKKIQEHLRED